jgi:citrate lyase subunit beta-like protein
MKMLEKSRGLTVDTVAYDLEDSVTLDKKPEARSNLTTFLQQAKAPGIKEQAVRINSVDSGLALHDLNSVLQAPNLDAIVIPKVNSASDLHFVTDVIRHTLPGRHPPSGAAPSDTSEAARPLRLIALVESAKAVMDLRSICASSPYLSGLIFAAEDFALDMSITRTPSLTEFLYARTAIATAARAFELPSTIDLVCTAFRGEEGLRTLEDECRGGKGLGFNGKQLIHPSQVEVAQRVFSPEAAEVEWAVRVVLADAKAEAQGRGAWTLDGKMIDAPVSGKARALVKKAELCGFDVGALKAKWKDQEPE